MKKEIYYIRAVTLICLCFGVLGILAAFFAGSSSMFFDGLYSLVQSVFILLSGFVVKLIGRKDDEYYQFGYGAFEPFYLVIRTLVLISMSILQAVRAGIVLVGGGNTVEAAPLLAFTALSVVACLAVYIVLKRKAKEFSSPILRLEAKSWLLDTLISVGVLLSFALMKILESAGFFRAAMLIDPILTILFAASLMPTLMKQLLSGVRDLLNAAPPEEAQERLEEIVARYGKSYPFRSWHIYATKLGRTVFSTIHIVLERDMPISAIDAIRKKMLKEIVSSWAWSDTDIVFTVDPSWMEYAVPVQGDESMQFGS